ncbi:FliG C-terminal domain-containing protein [Candidatus Latescibacterota bacterium]
MPALPTRPSLRHLKNEAKDLHKALKAGDSAAAGRVREHLPSLAHGDKTAEEVSLQEVQHALAQEYGHKTWTDLQQSLDVHFGDLIKLSDQDVRFILREIDQKDLVIAVKQPVSGDEEAVRDHLFMHMTPRVRTFLGQEMEYLGPWSDDEVEEVQQRILDHICQMGETGRIAWPLGSEEGPNAPLPPPVWPPELDLVRRPLEELSVDEVRGLCRGLCQRARESGILSLEEVADEAVSPRIQEATRLAADGTEPDLLSDILHTRRQALVHHLDTRMRMIIEGVMCLHSRDQPAIVIHKLNAVYSPYKADYREPEGTLEQIRERLAGKPVSEMDPDELTMIIADAADYARRDGWVYMTRVADLVDEELLAVGLRMVGEEARPDDTMDTLEPRYHEIVRAEDLRLRLVADGITAIQQAVDLAGLEEVLDETQAEMEAEVKAQS